MAIFENSRLTKRAIDALTPRAKPFIAFDSDVKGFGCRVQPSGLKTFVLEYRPGAGGRSSPKRRLTLGRYGSITPDQARKAALNALAQVRLGSLGSDPQAEKSRQRTARDSLRFNRRLPRRPRRETQTEDQGKSRLNDASAPMHNNGSAGLLIPLVAHEFSGQRIPNQSHDTHANHYAAQ